jgi:hypothetical protein
LYGKKPVAKTSTAMGIIMLERARAIRFDVVVFMFLAALWFGPMLIHPLSTYRTWYFVAIDLVDCSLLSTFLVAPIRDAFLGRACGESSRVHLQSTFALTLTLTMIINLCISLYYASGEVSNIWI